MGHFARMCRFGKRKSEHDDGNYRKKHKVHSIKEESDDEGASPSYHCFRVDCEQYRKLEDDCNILCKIGNTHVTMLIDSGCNLNMIAEKTWEKISMENPNIPDIVKNVNATFKAYASSEDLNIKGKFDARLSLQNGNSEIATFYVVSDGKQSLLGKISAMNLGVLRVGLDICNVNQDSPFPKIKNVKIQLKIDPNVRPVVQPYRRIPIALEEKVENKLNDALKMGIIEPVEYSPWVSPIVVVLKNDKDIRVCVDMRMANQAILRENYPMPTFDDLIHRLKDAKVFSRLDVKNAFHQLELSPESREITTFITHRGLFRYMRLLFGINAAPEIFQKVFERILSKCSGTFNYLDDIIIFGETKQIHDQNLQKVLKVLKENDVLLNEEKCLYGL
jgi:hypothetical protein